MPPEDRAELAHPEAAGWALGNLDPAEAEEFGRHLPTCPHCQAAAAELSTVSQVLRRLPPAVEPPPELEDRTIASVLTAVAQDREKGQAHQSPATGAEAPETGTGARVIRFPRWRGHVGLLATAAVAAAAAIVAVVVITAPGSKPAQTSHAVTVDFALHSPMGGPAGGQAVGTDHGPAGWSFRLSVHGLQPLSPDQFYECWYVGPTGHPKISGGTFTLGPGGAGTFTMWSAADPHTFRTMWITKRTIGEARSGTIVLTAQARQ
jgi:hypothetical protein